MLPAAGHRVAAREETGTTVPVLHHAGSKGSGEGMGGCKGDERAYWVFLAKLGEAGSSLLPKVKPSSALVLSWWDQMAASHSPVQNRLFGAGSWARLGNGWAEGPESTRG